jgi:phosphoglycolate phosphatase-like HAD superfamily hydrolase
MKSLIFDLDLTLVDSTIAEGARSKRDWKTVYSLIPQFIVYPGLEEIFNFISEFDITTAIVSTAPKSYIERVVQHFNMPIKFTIGYHDAKPIKPHSAPMLKALELMNDTSENVISFGDRAIDIQSSNAAKICSVACFWGTKERNELANSGYSWAIYNPIEIIPLIE